MANPEWDNYSGEDEKMIQDIYRAYREGFRIGRYVNTATPSAYDFVRFLEEYHPSLMPYYNLKVIAEVM